MILKKFSLKSFLILDIQYSSLNQSMRQPVDQGEFFGLLMKVMICTRVFKVWSNMHEEREHPWSNESIFHFSRALCLSKGLAEATMHGLLVVDWKIVEIILRSKM